MKKVKKLIIPAAGWGTRFLPMTKVVHKELVPVLNKPIIDWLIHEALNSGIEEIILVISPRKEEINNYFDINYGLEYELAQKGKTDILELIQKTNIKKHITVVYQNEQLGLGHAIAVAASKIKNEPFAVILGDDLIMSQIPAIKQLIEQYEKLGNSIVGVQSIKSEHLDKYGVVDPLDPEQKNAKIFEIKGAVEKPKLENSPSNKAILGRYVFTPEILAILKKLKPENNSEIQLVDAFDELLKTQKIYAYEFEGTRYDLGSVEGFVKANIDYALEDPEIQAEIVQFIKAKKL
ncbi:UTP--glucose-1-phosphate uridylyltransferase [Mycoplasma iguanae]